MYAMLRSQLDLERGAVSGGMKPPLSAALNRTVRSLFDQTDESACLKSVCRNYANRIMLNLETEFNYAAW